MNKFQIIKLKKGWAVQNSVTMSITYTDKARVKVEDVCNRLNFEDKFQVILIK